MSFRPYQQRAVDQIEEAFKRYRMVLLHLPTGAGKCLGRGTPVMLYSGHIVPVEEIRVGDLLMGPDSKPRAVLSLASGVSPLFRIRPTKGDSWVCNDVHVLTLVDSESSKIVDIPLDEYLKKSKTFKHTHKQFRSAVEFESNKNVLFDPYLMGVWLGDGHSNGPTITVSLKKTEIKKYIEKFCTDNDMEMNSSPGDGCENIRISMKNGSRKWYGNALTEESKLFLNSKNEKIIPLQYLTSSKENRMLLLAGMMDTDGCVSKSGYDWISKSEALADNLCFLARSLGLAAYKTKCTKSIKSINFSGTYYRVSISGDCSDIPCLVNKAPKRLQKKSVLRTGFEVESIEEGEYFGFTLDGDGRFLLGDFTVTHNTHIFSHFLKERASRGLKCMMAVRGRQLVDQASNRLRHEQTPHGVIMAGHWNKNARATIQLASIDTIMSREQFPEVDFLVIDEAHLMTSDRVHRFMNQYPKAQVLAVTATAYGRESLRHLAEVIIKPVSFKELFSDGYLVPPLYAPPREIVNLTGVRTLHGEYNERDILERMQKLTGNMPEHWIEHANGLPSLGFAVNLMHSHTLTQVYRQAGIPCEEIEGKHSFEERQAAFDRLARGDTKIVFNVGVATTGVDLPFLQCLIHARPTKSYNLYVQICGRGTRPFPGKKNFLMLDHAGNAMRHGELDDEPTPDLDGRTELPLSRLRQCQQCFVYYKGNQCHACDFVPPPVFKGKEIELEEGVLEVLEELPEGARIAVFIRRQKEIALRKGYKKQWVYHQVKSMYGEEIAEKCYPQRRSATPWFLRR